MNWDKLRAKERVAKQVRAFYGTDGPPPTPSAFATQARSEKSFQGRCQSKNIVCYRAGWPDFLCYECVLGWVAVEVKKHDADPLRPSQASMFAALHAAGLKVYIWTPQHRDRLVSWKRWPVEASDA